MGTTGPVVHREPMVFSSGQGMQELFSAQNEAKEDSLCPLPLIWQLAMKSQEGFVTGDSKSPARYYQIRVN